jgi:hypothetical protein
MILDFRPRWDYHISLDYSQCFLMLALRYVLTVV